MTADEASAIDSPLSSFLEFTFFFFFFLTFGHGASSEATSALIGLPTIPIGGSSYQFSFRLMKKLTRANIDIKLIICVFLS